MTTLPYRPARATRVPARRGFTLVEALVVIVMIGLLLGIMLPRMGVDRWQAKASAQSVGSSLLLAQREAMAKQYNILVLFDQSRNAIRIVYDSADNGRADAADRSRTIYLGDGVTFGRPSDVPGMPMGNATVSFSSTEPVTGLPVLTYYRNGSAKEFGWFYLTTLKALGSGQGTGRSWAVVINRATGRPEWNTYTPSGWKRGF